MPTNKLRSVFGRPKYTIIALALIVALGASILALWFGKSNEASATATEPPLAARLESAQGNVGISQYAEQDAQQLNATTDGGDWFNAVPNSPLTPGDRIYTGDDSRARIAFNARNYASVNPLTSLDLLSLTDQQTQLALRNGSAIFDVGDLESGELFEVATPQCAVDFVEPGLYQVGIEDGGNTIISVLSGLAQVISPGGTGQLSAGEVLTVAGAIATEALVSRLSSGVAGGILNDYYYDRYPDVYDGRYADYDVYLSEPDYYDTYAHSPSYEYVGSYDVPGLYDLDRYGDWIDVDDYGRCWAPRVDSGWAPYRHGSWRVHDLWGPSWISTEPWGWAPYHYGRWAYVDHRGWVWVPDRIVSRPVYSPALVAFIPLERSNQIGWCPLAPGEPYLPRYYSDYQPHYFADQLLVRQVVYTNRTYRNLSVPGCVTAAPIDSFTRFGGRPWSRRVESHLLAGVQPVLDPFSIHRVRDTAKAARRSRRSIGLPPQFNERLQRTAVVTSREPVVLPVQDKLRRSFRTEAVAEKQRRNKVRFRETGVIASALRANGIPQAPIAETRRKRIDRSTQNQVGLQSPSQDVNSRVDGVKARRDEVRRLKQQQKAAQRLQGPPMPPTREGRPNVQPAAATTKQEQKRARREERQLQRRAPAQRQPAKPPKRPQQNWQSNQPAAAAKARIQRAQSPNLRIEQRQLRRATKQAERQNRVQQQQRQQAVSRSQQAAVIKAQRQQQRSASAKQAQVNRQAIIQQQLSKRRNAERPFNQQRAERQELKVQRQMQVQRQAQQIRQPKRQVIQPAIQQRQPAPIQRVQSAPRQVRPQPVQPSVTQHQRKNGSAIPDAGANGKRNGKNKGRN